MIPLTQLKKDGQFNSDFTKIVDTLRGMAAARFRVLERQLALFEPYDKATAALLDGVDLRQVDHPFVQPRTEAVGVVMVTSDEGFLGGLNSQVVERGLREGGPGGVLTVIGEQGTHVLQELQYGATAFPGIDDASRLNCALTVRDHVVRQVLTGACGPLLVVYPRPLSFSIQEVRVERLLPCTAWASRKQAQDALKEVCWESDPADVVEYVVMGWIGHRLDEIFALSRLSELGARMVHLEGSYQELVRLGKKLRLQYLRVRHEMIDRSIREISSAQLLVGKSHAR